MSRSTPRMRDLATRLIHHEAEGKSTSAPSPPAAYAVCEKLRPHLATLVGKTGFRALLSRAVAMARGEVSWLSGVQVDAEGTLQDWETARAQSENPTDEAVPLVAELLGLLSTLIGENLTLRLMRGVWPTLSLDDLHSLPDESHEKA